MANTRTPKHGPDKAEKSQNDEQHLHTLNTILAASTEFISLFDPQGRYLFASENIATLFGLKQSDVLGKTWREVGLPAEFMDPFDIQRQKVMTTGQTVREEMLFPVETQMRWFSYVANPMMDAHGQVQSVVVTWQDITERKQVEEVTSRLASIVASSGDAIFSKTLQGVITSWNSGAETLYGYTAGEMIGQSVSLLIPPDRHNEMREILALIAAGEPVKNHETIRMRKDGTHVEVAVTVSPIRDIAGRIVGASTIAHDMSEQKRMEGELARREDEREQIMHQLESLNQQLDSLFAHAPAGLVLFDARPPYRVLLHNTFFQKFFPEPFYSEGMQGKYLSDYVSRAEEDGVAEVFRQVVSTRQGVTLFNFVYDGMPRGRTWWNWHLAPIIKDGEVTALTQMVIETTHEVLARHQLETELAERKRGEDVLRQSHDELVTVNAALEEANRARSQFLSTMSHELRTPLASIIGFSQLLLDHAANADWKQQQQNNLERILKNGQHLLSLINDVLDLSKTEAGRMVVTYSQVNVRELLTSVVEEIQSLAIARHLVLSVEVKEGVDFLESDMQKLHQILLNLVSNALKFTERGEVTVSARRAISPYGKADRLALAVHDSGIGIPIDVQEHIFEAFYQVDGGYTRKVGGTGLGLSIVRQLTTLLGGTIELTSAPGRGSTFTVILPIRAVHQPVEQDIPRLLSSPSQKVPSSPSSSPELTPTMLEEVCAVSAPREAPDGQKQVVLAVDDNPDVLFLIKAALKDTSYMVVGVQDPSQAIELVQEVRPCAIILDVMMPGVNGWQVLYQLKTNPVTTSIPVVMLSVHSEPTAGYVLGAETYLLKPFQTEAMLTTLQRVITTHHHSVESFSSSQQA